MIGAFALINCQGERDYPSSPKDEAVLLGEWYNELGEKITFEKNLTGQSESENLKLRIGGVELTDFQWEFDYTSNALVLSYENKLITSSKSFQVISVSDRQLVLSDVNLNRETFMR
jgi:hypothetical protein